MFKKLFQKKTKKDKEPLIKEIIVKHPSSHTIDVEYNKNFIKFGF